MILQEGMDSTIQQLSETQQVGHTYTNIRRLMNTLANRTKTLLTRQRTRK